MGYSAWMVWAGPHRAPHGGSVDAVAPVHVLGVHGQRPQLGQDAGELPALQGGLLVIVLVLHNRRIRSAAAAAAASAFEHPEQREQQAPVVCMCAACRNPEPVHSLAHEGCLPGTHSSRHAPAQHNDGVFLNTI